MVVGAWLFIVFANALADASAQSSRLERERAANAELQARVDAGSVEIAAIQGRTFLDFWPGAMAWANRRSASSRSRPVHLRPG